MEYSLEVEFGGHSSAGKKSSNDDAFSAHAPSNHSTRKNKGIVACMADGISHSTLSQFASQTSVTHFINDYYSTSDAWTVKQSASKVISSLNAWLYHHGSRSHTRSDSAVTTFSSAVIKSRTAHIFHVGDSRIYLFRQGHLEQISHDHKAAQGNGQHYLTRALGIDSRLDVDYSKEVLEEGDILLLSTDGFHDFISETEIQNALTTFLTQSKTISLETTAIQLVDTAKHNDSDDNISCLLVHVKSLPTENLKEAHQKLTSLAIPPVLKRDNKLDHFLIKRVLHSSTRSHIYLAEDTRDGSRVVLKAPSENFADDIAYLDAFRREYWLGRKLNSRYVMKIQPHPNNTRFLYHICEYIEGKTLRQWMIDNPKPDFEVVRVIIKDIATALRTLHRNSVIHRDLKPENIMLDQDMNITLIDLGTAQIAGLEETSPFAAQTPEQALPVGDIHYLAPEYILNNQGNNQSDLFSLACILYEMISGELPYQAIRSNRHIPTRVEEWEYQNLGQLENRDIPVWINQVLKKATAPKQSNRYEALSEFIADLFEPSADILNISHQPLIERNPLLFWQLLSAVLCIVIILQWYFL